MLLKYMYSQKQDGDFMQMFKIYMEPEPLSRTKKIQQFLKSKGIKRVSSVLIPTLFVAGFAYALPGNTYGQYFIKTKFAELKIKYYRFLQHYSDHPKSKSEYSCKYLKSLNDQFLTLISVGENPSELYGNIITQMTQTLYDDNSLIDFVIMQLDLLNARVVENNYFDVYRVYSNQIIDLIDIININLKQVSEQEISSKYYQYELIARGLVTCFLGCLKYTQDKKQRQEVINFSYQKLYNYSYQINQKNGYIKQKLYDQFKGVLPEVYRDIAVNDQQLNLNALLLINQIANSNIKNSLLNQLVQDQLPSNLLKHKFHKDIQLDQQIIYLLNLIINQKEVLYSLKNIYDQEHKNILEQLKKYQQDQLISIIISNII